MRIRVAELADSVLAGMGPVLRCRPEDMLYCSNIRFWDGIYDPDCLYIARSSDLEPTPPPVAAPYQLQMLLIEDLPAPAAWLACPEARILSFPGSADPLRLFNTISDSGFCLPRYAMKLTELLESIPDDDYDTIAKRVSNILGRKATLLTPGLRALSGPDDDRPKQDRHLRRLRELDLSGHLAPVMLSSGERKVWPLKEFPGEVGELLTPITHDGELRDVLGYIYCPDFPKADAVANLPALRYISRLLTSRFVRFIRENRGGDAAFSLLLGKIISGEMKDNATISTQLQQLGFVVPKNMVLITVLADSLSPDDLVECAECLYRDVWPQTKAALVGNQIILLIGRDELPVVTPEELSRFEKHLAEYQCTAGISEVFHSFDRYLRNHFHRSFCAAIVASQRGGQRYTAYKNCALYHLSSDTTNVAALSPFKDAFVDPRLMQLIEYDNAHSTDYLTTLRYYWIYNRSSTDICRLLHIQRSTLFYRLTKIREILEQDFNDYHSLIQLSVGISILEARGLIPTLNTPEEPPAPGKALREEL